MFYPNLLGESCRNTGFQDRVALSLGIAYGFGQGAGHL